MRARASTTITALLLAAPAAAQAPRRITLTEAIQMSLDRGSEIKGAIEGVRASSERVSGTSAQRWPALRADASLQYWDKPLELAFAGGMPMPGMPVPKLTVRDQLTWQATVSLAQPISGLLVVSKLIDLERDGLDAARADQRRARLDTAQRAAEAYLRLLQAQALEQIAGKTVSQVEAQLGRAKVLEQGGVLAAVDALRLTSARDSARANQLRARTGVTIAAAALVLALELPPGTAVEVVDDLPDPPPPVTWQEGEVARQAQAERPELVAALERAEQARAGRGVAQSRLLPNIMAVASYQRTVGQPFFPVNAFFIGGTLSWDLWDWGKNWSGVKEAEARANQAQIAVANLRDQIAFDARRRLLEARTTYETLAVARSVLQAAEEAHRIQSVRYQGGAATTTDVLDAETDVARARSGYAQARYDYYLAQAALARAVGRMPSVSGGPNADR